MNSEQTSFSSATAAPPLSTQQAVTLAAGVQADPRSERARPHLARFCALTAQLALLLGVFGVYHLEQFHGPGDIDFFSMCCIVFGAFAVHYWLPFRFKEKFWVTVSTGSAFLYLEPRAAVALLAVGLVFYLVLASSMSYSKRVVLVGSGFVAVMVLSRKAVFFAGLPHGFSLPTKFWPVFGAIFMFRLIIYLYDLQNVKDRPSLTNFLAYFFILPNYVFLLFPVVDYKTMRMGYYSRDIHECAQEGVFWICRGALQLLLYRIVFNVLDMLALQGTNSFLSAVLMMFLTFLLYLRVSGQFHIIIGVLHLFGYDLPETNHKYLLSHSLNDFWRRINIYWKEFMVKIVYFPIYFRLRKQNEFRAKMVATAVVFAVTWALHSYQSFWLSGHFAITWQDTLFWAILGLLVMANVWWDMRHPHRHKRAGTQGYLLNGISNVATLGLIITLWSLWSAPSVTAWIDFLTWWRPRG